EPEEGVEITRDLLDHNPSLRRQPISAGEVHGHSEWLTADGDLRTLPCHLGDPDSRMGGFDGFYAARLPLILKGYSRWPPPRPPLCSALRDPRTPAREGANASMARVSVAEGTRLSVFLARGLLGRVTSRVTTHPIVNWPFSFGKADRIVIAPQDLRTSDA